MLNKLQGSKLLLSAAILAVLAAVVSLSARWYPLFPCDLSLALHFQSLANPIFTEIMKWTDLLFTSWPAGLMVIITGIIIGLCIGKKEGLFVWAAGVITLLSEPIKWVVGRPRPSMSQLQVIGTNDGSSFPSGHTVFATVFLGILIYTLLTRLRNRTLRVFSLALLILLAFLVYSSRVYLGAHWPSDVLGGIIIGSLFLVLLIWACRKLNISRKNRAVFSETDRMIQ